MSLLPTPKYVDKLEKSNAINNDIISTIHKNYNTAVFQTKKIAPSLKGANDVETAKNVWLFLKRKLKYKRDPEGKQMIKLPSRLLQPTDRTADCKSYSLLAASLLANNGLKPTFRYASYKEYEKTPTHVYVTTKDSNGNEIIVDGCYRQFNDQKKYFYKYDYPMEVYTLSGVNGPLKKLVKKVAPKAQAKAATKKAVKQEKKAVKKVEKAKKKEVKKVIKAEKKVAKKAEKAENKKKPLLKRVAQGAKKVAIAPSRTAFLGLVRINAHGLATKLAEASKKNSNKVKNWWSKLGGSPAELTSVITLGAKQKAILGIGVVTAATIGAALVTAAPIIVATASILKTVGIKSETIDKVAKTAENLYKDETGKSAVEAAKEAIDETTGSGSGDEGEPTSLFSTKNILISGGVVAGIYFLPKLLKSKK